MRPRLLALQPVVLAAVLLQAFEQSATGQEHGQCSEECPIALEFVATLRVPSTHTALGEYSQAAEFANGTIVVTPGSPARELYFFDAAGAFLKAINAKSLTGDRPSMISIVGAVGDSLFVYAGGSGLTGILRSDGTMEMTFDLPVIPGGGVVAADSATLMVQGRSQRAQGFGYRMHLLTWDGELLKSFSEPPGIVARASPRLSSTIISAFAPYHPAVWEAPMTAPALRLWSQDGQTVLEYKLDLQWFRPWTVFNECQPTHLSSAAPCHGPLYQTFHPEPGLADGDRC